MITKIKCVFGALLCFLFLAAAAAVRRGAGVTESVHVTGALLTLYEASPTYLLPTWESPLTVFGVKAESDVDLMLIRPSDGAFVIISIQVSEFHGETQLTNPVGVPITIVTRDVVTLNPYNFTWFTVFRRKNFIGLFLENEARVTLAYKQEKSKVDFLDYTHFKVKSFYEAEWDFLGYQYPGLGKGPGYMTVVLEVQGVVKSLIHRLLTLEHVLEVKPLDRMPQTTKKAFFTHLRRAEAYIFLCRFYGFDFLEHVKFFPWRRLKAALRKLHKE